MALDKELRGHLRSGVKTLVLQEIRLLRFERTFTPDIIMDEISRSIEDEKRKIVRLARIIGYQERANLLRGMIQQAVDEEIDRSIQLRKNRCLRCIHGRFYDRSETAYLNLPLDENLAQTIGCDQLRKPLKKACRRFVETLTAHSPEDYLSEMTFLYEFREWIDQIEEIWRDYFLP
ncbi:MAG: hypothetical protein QME90_04515 [Thermodesulfobacteriota bacterium]|nr:hypothetical protein [Thermodesulfobacteriota bacterium]